MKKIMILGASILQLPAIIKAKEMGLYVIALDMNPDAIGFKYADHFEVISATDTINVLETAKKFKINGVMTLASDMPMRTVSKVAHELNLVGISEDTAIKATNKASMRESLLQNGVPIPQFEVVNDWNSFCEVIKKFKSRIIVKPVDNSGSRGIYQVNNIFDESEIMKAFKYAKSFSKDGRILVEEFIDGLEVSVESISIDGNCHIIQITDKLTTGKPYFVEMGHSQPSVLNSNLIDKIKKITVDAVNSIGLVNGPSHTEIKLCENGPKLIEIGARLGGDNITTHLVPLSTGLDIVEYCIKIAIGEKFQINMKKNHGSAIRYFKSKDGILKEINNLNEAKGISGVKQIEITKGIGEEIKEVKNSSDRIGFVIAQADEVSKAIQICEEAMKKISFVIE